jgi:hypothetical protein
LSSRRIIAWFSCGAASAVATKLALLENPEAIVAYCETGAEHADNARFITKCEKWLGKEILRLRSTKYKSTWDVWNRRKYLAGLNGAPCTVELKVAPRLMFQRPTDIQVFGYTADLADVKRASRFRMQYPEITLRVPLIDRGLTKAACLSILQRTGIQMPAMYRLGFQNNNCIPCVKATSPAYWALVRQRFPQKFARMARLSRKLGVRLCKIKEIRKFIDEIPKNHPTTNPIAPACDFSCQLAEQEIGVENDE